MLENSPLRRLLLCPIHISYTTSKHNKINSNAKFIYGDVLHEKLHILYAVTYILYAHHRG